MKLGHGGSGKILPGVTPIPVWVTGEKGKAVKDKDGRQGLPGQQAGLIKGSLHTSGQGHHKLLGEGWFGKT